MRHKILIVDDETDFVSLLKVRLEKNGYEVLNAPDGERGINICREKNPDLVLLDVMMPKKDGYTMLREMRADSTVKSIPVIVLTAKAEVRDLFEIEGVTDYIVKPFEDADLLLRIKRALQQ